MTVYIAGWNTPGTLPESEPVQFDTPDEAFAYLTSEVEMFWGQDEGGCMDGLATGQAATRWLPVHTALHNAPTAPWSVSTGDRSLEFWVHVEQYA